MDSSGSFWKLLVVVICYIVQVSVNGEADRRFLS